MANALWITLIGMGLVFAAILLLWGLLALLVRVTAVAEKAEPEAEPETPAVQERGTGSPGELQRKRRAAAAAVAITLALHRYGRGESASQPVGPISAWQIVHRTGQIGQRVTTASKKVVR